MTDALVSLHPESMVREASGKADAPAAKKDWKWKRRHYAASPLFLFEIYRPIA